MHRTFCTILLSAGLGIASAAHAADEARPAPATRPAAAGEAKARVELEVAFVLDTTGSMGGLIEGAKAKIWSIANTIIEVNDKPQIKLGLIGYRDRGDEYVTKRFDLTDDIDAVFKNLMAFKADGGKDTPESVNQALDEAVTKLAWSEKDSVIKILFLVGDAPPHMDYADDVKYQKTCELAAKKGIAINAVQCGDVAGTAEVWREIAKLGKGAYIPLAQEGGMIAIATPHDKELAELQAKVNATVVAYGAIEVQKEVNDKLAAAATQPAAIAAERAKFFAKNAEAVAFKDAPDFNLAVGGAPTVGTGGDSTLFARNAISGHGDLVWSCVSGHVKLEDLKEDQLPEHMRKMTPAQRKEYIAEQVKQREALQRQIAEVSAKRDAYIVAEREKLVRERAAATASRAAGAAPSAPADAFDSKVTDVVREQVEARK